MPPRISEAVTIEDQRALDRVIDADIEFEMHEVDLREDFLEAMGE